MKCVKYVLYVITIESTNVHVQRPVTEHSHIQWVQVQFNITTVSTLHQIQDHLYTATVGIPGYWSVRTLLNSTQYGMCVHMSSIPHSHVLTIHSQVITNKQTNTGLLSTLNLPIPSDGSGGGRGNCVTISHRYQSQRGNRILTTTTPLAEIYNEHCNQCLPVVTNYTHTDYSHIWRLQQHTVPNKL